jgi:hypothetical protein
VPTTTDWGSFIASGPAQPDPWTKVLAVLRTAQRALDQIPDFGLEPRSRISVANAALVLAHSERIHELMDLVDDLRISARISR